MIEVEAAVSGGAFLKGVGAVWRPQQLVQAPGDPDHADRLKHFDPDHADRRKNYDTDHADRLKNYDHGTC